LLKTVGCLTWWAPGLLLVKILCDLVELVLAGPKLVRLTTYISVFLWVVW
jgi:hypothetical protein